jgi:hypothetical protein
VSQKAERAFRDYDTLFSTEYFSTIGSPTLVRILAQSVVKFYQERVVKLRESEPFCNSCSPKIDGIVVAGEPKGVVPPTCSAEAVVLEIGTVSVVEEEQDQWLFDFSTPKKKQKMATTTEASLSPESYPNLEPVPEDSLAIGEAPPEKIEDSWGHR